MEDYFPNQQILLSLKVEGKESRRQGWNNDNEYCQTVGKKFNVQLYFSHLKMNLITFYISIAVIIKSKKSRRYIVVDSKRYLNVD